MVSDYPPAESTFRVRSQFPRATCRLRHFEAASHFSGGTCPTPQAAAQQKPEASFRPEQCTGSICFCRTVPCSNRGRGRSLRKRPRSIIEIEVLDVELEIDAAAVFIDEVFKRGHGVKVAAFV